MSNVTSLRGKRTGVTRKKMPGPRLSRIHTLGIFKVIGPNGEDILPRTKKAQAVLGYLCLSGGQPVSRSYLAGLIWDRSSEEHARDSLRQALNELERVGGSWQLERERNTVRLDTSGCWIDAFEPPDRPDQLLESIYGISPPFDQWLIGERARFEQRWQAALEKELNELIDQHAASEVRVAAARRLLNFVPTHEPAVRCLMSAFLELDDRALAIREYERFREFLDRTWACAHRTGPSPSMRRYAVPRENHARHPVRPLPQHSRIHRGWNPAPASRGNHR